MEEQWKQIIIDGINYENYKVSTYGRVKNIKTGTILKPIKKKDGYFLVRLSRKGKVKQCYLHRLVALMFIPNDNNLPQVNHIDENKSNNHVENLEWCDGKYNMTYSHGKSIRCVETGQIFESVSQASEIMNLHRPDIIRALRNRYRVSGGYHWEYVD